MNLTGIIKDVQCNWENNKWQLLIEVNERPSEEINQLSQCKKLTLCIKKYRKKRSLTANKYFHKLCDMLAESLGNSKPYQKNYLMGRYGQKDLDENGRWKKLSVLENVDMLERNDIHCTIIGYATLQGKNFIHYGIMRPTHTYTSKEMAILIDGTVQDAKEQGLETLPPAEIKNLVSKWKPHKKDDCVI